MQSWALAATAAGLLLALAVAELPAQQRDAAAVVEPDTLPPRGLAFGVADPIVSFLNDPTTLRFSGNSRVPAGTLIVGNVGVLGGVLEVAGRIQGDVVVVNGDLELLSGSSIDGRVTVVGGQVYAEQDARITGELTTHAEQLAYSRQGERIVYTDDRPAGPPLPGAREPEESRRDLLIASGGSYNRVEGLPITFGPVFDTGGPRPFRARAMAIYRTESGASLDPERMGFRLRAEQSLMSGRALRVGATAFSVIDQIERWHMQDLESSLSTFLLHRDHRDHYERRGWSGFVAMQRPGSPLAMVLEGRSERHLSVPAGSPWTLFRNQESWRPQPLVAEGRVSVLGLRGRFDTRSSDYDPATGWYIEGSTERSLRSSLADPAMVPVGPLPITDPQIVPAHSYRGFTTGFVDLRRYNRLSPDARLNLRLVLGGSLDRSAVPPQRQHALGGEGSLPGYSLFSLDCGARQQPVYRAAQVSTPVTSRRDLPPVYVPAYGCDEIALVQAEYRGRLNLRLGWEDRGWGDTAQGWDLAWAAAPEWVAFLDAGRGWSQQRQNTDTAVDIGVGLLFHRLGIFTAVPLRGEGGVNLFVRLGPRF
jgi:hypothetical protein